MNLVWSAPARRDLLDILSHIANDSPSAAHAVVDRIEAAVERLAAYPHLGRPGRVDGTRELVIPDLPYVVAYRVVEGRTNILRVWHTAKDWPAEF